MFRGRGKRGALIAGGSFPTTDAGIEEFIV
jgi:hypothetical protein